MAQRFQLILFRFIFYFSLLVGLASFLSIARATAGEVAKVKSKTDREASVSLSAEGARYIFSLLSQPEVVYREDLVIDAYASASFWLSTRQDAVKARIKYYRDENWKLLKTKLQVSRQLQKEAFICGAARIESSTRQSYEQTSKKNFGQERLLVNARRLQHRLQEKDATALALLREMNVLFSKNFSAFSQTWWRSVVHNLPQEAKMVPAQMFRSKKEWRVREDIAGEEVEFKLVRVRDWNHAGQMVASYQLEGEARAEGVFTPAKIAQTLCEHFQLAQKPTRYFEIDQTESRRYSLFLLNRYFAESR